MRRWLRGRTEPRLPPMPDVLSELGEAANRVVRADEALPFAAIATVPRWYVLHDSVAPADGIAALLRYVPTDIVTQAGGAPGHSVSP